jgi:hypothetical protein
MNKLLRSTGEQVTTILSHTGVVVKKVAGQSVVGLAERLAAVATLPSAVWPASWL